MLLKQYRFTNTSDNLLFLWTFDINTSNFDYHSYQKKYHFDKKFNETGGEFGLLRSAERVCEIVQVLC